MNSTISYQNKCIFGAKLRVALIAVSLIIFAGCYKYSTQTANQPNPLYLSEGEIKLFEEEAKQGDIESAGKLANYYAIVVEDPDKAIEFFRIQAEKGDLKGQYNLAVFLTSSSNLKNQQEGVSWYEISAKNGDVSSQESLAGLYEDGDIVEQDYCRAKYWYEESARSGDIVSIVKMSEFFEAGKCCNRDFVQAYTWLLVATEQKDQVHPDSLVGEKIACFETKLSDYDKKKAKDECGVLLKEIEHRKTIGHPDN